MTISILLLLLFQAYWLRNAFSDEYRRLRRELSVSLREAVVRQQIQHFLISKDKEAKDSGWVGKKDSNSVLIIQREKSPASPVKIKMDVNISSSRDSSQKTGRNNLFFESERHFDDDFKAGEMKVAFPTPFGVDNMSEVEKDFRKSLDEANIQLSFKLLKEAGDSSLWNGMTRFRRNFGDRELNPSMVKLKAELLVADFGNPFYYILKRMQWQLLFAFSMFFITLSAFLFLYRNLRQQHQLAAIKNDFIANITHELKTPVATVSVAIEALKNFNAIHDAERTKEYLDISTAELQRLGLLVDKVMKLSMFEQDKMDLRKEPIDMKQLVEEVMRSMKLQFEKQEANVLFDFTGDRFMTTGDRMHLQSVVFNLLDNALKYSPVDPAIEIKLFANSGKISLTIADNGIGIAPEYRNKVFEKFFRVPHGDTHNIKGYGLGLSYVCEVVKKHGGDIRVDSKEGTGSIFTVELPAAKEA